MAISGLFLKYGFCKVPVSSLCRFPTRHWQWAWHLLNSNNRQIMSESTAPNLFVGIRRWIPRNENALPEVIQLGIILGLL
jgi:hypothetical protein